MARIRSSGSSRFRREISPSQRRTRKIEREYLFRRRARSQPGDGAGLAEADAMPVPLSRKDEAIARSLHREQRASDRAHAEDPRDGVAEDFAADDKRACAA